MIYGGVKLCTYLLLLEGSRVALVTKFRETFLVYLEQNTGIMCRMYYESTGF